ncbi:unnamed protein product [Rotaria magnacalcarata]|uniref:SH2 domain-containing protein n=2 Tax=Rotaria magnacalcarata TaxID=392030 RepID=A0A816RA77_9BILA|nr:unnamed protein product [Rotaria magnacalcarata]CAF2242327.1 unnamed protein product [Rotaria magnacalcarata]
MIAKSKALKSSLTTKKTVNAFIDYTSPKYADIEKRWIIYEGHLNYRYGQIKFLNLSKFAIYYVVLAKLPTAYDKRIMVMYLYRNPKNKSSNVFQLDDYEKLSDQCSKTIKSQCYLFELIGKNQRDIEIFGTITSDERDKWMKYVQQALNYKDQNSISNNFSNVRQDRSGKDDLQNKDCIETGVNYNYQPSTQKQERESPHLYTPSTSCYRPASCIQYKKSLGSNENNETKIEQRHRFDSLQTEDNIYLSVKPTPSVFYEEHDKKNKYIISQPELQRKTEQGLSTSTTNKSFTWDDIFYTNDLNDHANILITICQDGAFLVRPQSNKTNSNNHDYTLSIYTFGEVIKYKILSLPNKTYTLQNNKSQSCFVDIPDLCQYYTNHRLPCSTSRADCTKGNFKNAYLTWPYTYYCHTNKY